MILEGSFQVYLKTTNVIALTKLSTSKKLIHKKSTSSGAFLLLTNQILLRFY